jgi:hypothetical protein
VCYTDRTHASEKNLQTVADMKKHTQAPLAFCHLVIISILLAQISPVKALASSVFAFSNNQGTFSIQANNLNRMTKAEVRINYQVTDQSSAAQVTLYPNLQYTLTQSSVPGYLAFTLVYKEKVYPKNNPKGIPNPLLPLSGDYKLLAVVGIAGDITSLTSTICSEKTGCESLQGAVTNPAQKEPDKKDDQVDNGGKAGTADSAVDSGNAVDAASRTRTETTDPVIVPQERTSISPADEAPAERRTNQPPGEPVGKSSSTAADRNVARRAETEETARSLSFARRESLIERFGASGGERSSTALARLLTSPDSSFIQDPPLLLSDGIATLRLTLQTQGRGEHSPQFFISGSSCIDFKAGKNGSWILEILPERGTLAASVMVLEGREVIEYPLAVAPPLDIFDANGAKTGLVEYVRAANELVRSKPLP